MSEVSFSQCLADLAAAHPERPMVSLVSATGAPAVSATWSEINRAANRLARELMAGGVELGDYVTIALPNGIDFFTATIACWRIGAIPQPVSSRLPVRELDAIVALADSRAVIGVKNDRYPDRFSLPLEHVPSPDFSADALPDRISPSWKAPTSGGSTGRPKLIVSGDAAIIDPADPGFADLLQLKRFGTTVVPGPMYHNGPFVWAFTQVLQGGHVVVLDRFDSAATLDAVQQFCAHSLYLVPTMMSRISKLPSAQRAGYDVSSLDVVWHLAAPCPVWLKHEWINWLGAERVWELYGGTEGQCATIISGTEWLTHEGSVGRPVIGELCILDEAGEPLGAGAVGEVFMRPEPGQTTYRYVGAQARVRGDGWESLGDMGWLDDEGYLYLADRRTDMILSGGANIYPAEVEAALEAHPAVLSCAVIGLRDPDLGDRVHAIVQADGVGEDELIAHVAERLVRYKVPRTIEFVSYAVRDDAGKVRRSTLRDERDRPN